MGQIRKEDANGMFIFEPRFDLVGTEVDRFFRITKFSIPGLVMAGESLYNTYLSAKSSAKGLRYPSDPEVLQPKDLKGLYPTPTPP